jgi:phosphate transport system substrate-binding protein
MLPITKRNTFLLAISVLLTTVGEPILIRQVPALADNTVPTTPRGPAPFPLPSAVPSGSKVTVDGSSSMKNINNALKKQFETKFSGTEVVVSENGTDASLKALRDGTIDLAAIGRPLTPAEKAEGFKEYSVTRHKIAMIVGPENPFNQSLTIEQFAQIFRGEIKDWSKVGGAVGVIRVIDRPETSDTRQAFNNYPVFQKAPLKTGDNAKTVAEDQTDLVVADLGKDGIGYAIADQVQGRTDVRILKMHETLPNDSHYPFSQPLVYVYKGAEPSNAAKAFLGYALAADNAAVIEEARQENVGVVAQAPAEPEPAVVEPENERGRFPWWLLLLAPLLLLPFLLKGRAEPEPAVIADPMPAPPPPPPVPLAPSRLILTPRDCRNAYAYWEVPSERFAQLQGDGRKLVIRLYDATDINLDYDQAHRVEEYECNEWEQDLHIPIAVDDRDYVAELGYVSNEGEWFAIAKSDAVRVPACQPQIDLPTAVAASTAAGAIGLASLSTTETSRLILTPRSCKEAYAYWEVPEEHKTALRRQGGEKLMLRVYDATNLDLDDQTPHSMEEYECTEDDPDLIVPIPVDDRDYVAELGYKAIDGSWYSLARSLHVRIPACDPIEPINPLEAGLTTDSPTAGGFVETGREKAGNLFKSGQNALENLFDTDRDKIDYIRPSDILKSGGTTIAAGLGATAAGIRDFFNDDDTEDRELQDKILLKSRNSEEALVSWNISEAEKEVIRNSGGQRLALRVYDMTDTNLDGQPDSVWEYECEEFETEKLVRIYSEERDYVAELGYISEEGRWLPLAKSNVLKAQET